MTNVVTSVACAADNSSTERSTEWFLHSSFVSTTRTLKSTWASSPCCYLARRGRQQISTTKQNSDFSVQSTSSTEPLTTVFLFQITQEVVSRTGWEMLSFHSRGVSIRDPHNHYYGKCYYQSIPDWHKFYYQYGPDWPKVYYQYGSNRTIHQMAALTITLSAKP